SGTPGYRRSAGRGGCARSRRGPACTRRGPPRRRGRTAGGPGRGAGGWAPAGPPFGRGARGPGGCFGGPSRGAAGGGGGGGGGGDALRGVVHQPAEGGGGEGRVAVALVEGAERVGLFGVAPAAALPGAHGVRGQDLFLAVEPVGRGEQRVVGGRHEVPLP